MINRVGPGRVEVQASRLVGAPGLPAGRWSASMVPVASHFWLASRSRRRLVDLAQCLATLAWQPGRLEGGAEPKVATGTGSEMAPATSGARQVIKFCTVGGYLPASNGRGSTGAHWRVTRDGFEAMRKPERPTILENHPRRRLEHLVFGLGEPQNDGPMGGVGGGEPAGQPLSSFWRLQVRVGPEEGAK